MLRKKLLGCHSKEMSLKICRENAEEATRVVL